MSDVLDDLKNKWDKAKEGRIEHPSAVELINLSRKKMREAVNMHIGNIVILTITLLGISAFFVYVAPLKEVTSHIGIFLMLGGLLLRIIIECYSIFRSSRIEISDSTSISNQKTLAFYAYRKRIHGPVTIGILLAYTVGFYMLTPEFANYFTTVQMIMMNVGYIIGAAIFGISIKKGIQKEMRMLDDLMDLRSELSEN